MEQMTVHGAVTEIHNPAHGEGLGEGPRPVRHDLYE